MADARLNALFLARQNSRTRTDIGQLLEDVRQTIDSFIKRHTKARYEGAIMSRELLDELSVAFSHLGLSDDLEDDLATITRTKTQSLIAIYDNGEEATEMLKGLKDRLEKMLG
jgi:hypothetical protein